MSGKSSGTRLNIRNTHIYTRAPSIFQEQERIKLFNRPQSIAIFFYLTVLSIIQDSIVIVYFEALLN